MSEDWRDAASCLGLASDGFDPWFPAARADFGGAHLGGSRSGLARKICNRCPVRPDCLADTLKAEHGQSLRTRHGIAGGLDPKQRLALDDVA